MYASQVYENSCVNSSARLKDKNLFIDEFSIYLIADKTAGETIVWLLIFFQTSLQKSFCFGKTVRTLSQRKVPPTRSSVVSAFSDICEPQSAHCARSGAKPESIAALSSNAALTSCGFFCLSLQRTGY